MKCLLRFRWVKLPRAHLPEGKGLMGYWAKLAARAAFRKGAASYCGYTNYVNAGEWAGGIVGLKSILGVKDRKKALAVMDELSRLGYLSYSLDARTKKLAYQIHDWVVQCSGAPCEDGAVYATDDYGFLCLPRNITERLVKAGHCFEESDAWLDLWCHTVYRDLDNVLSFQAPTIQFQREAALTLESLGNRWGWERTKVWRFFHKHSDTFHLTKLPGSYGCIITNTRYPLPAGFARTPITQATVGRILNQIRLMGRNTSFSGTDRQRINHLIFQFSTALLFSSAEHRVALSPCPYISRAYFSLHLCKNCNDDCWRSVIRDGIVSAYIRGPCEITGLFSYTKAKEN